MVKLLQRGRLVIVIIILSVYSCIETFFPKLPNKTGYLVIEALITDEVRAYDVYLTRSITAVDSKPTYVKGATVNITDNTGRIFTLKETTTGHYVTDSKLFTGQIGKTYSLYIKLTTGDEYRSENCMMYGTSTIDRVSLARSNKFLENGTEEITGLSLRLDGQVAEKYNCFLRWDLYEVWKFPTTYPQLYTYTPPSTFTAVEVKNRYCWKSNRPTDILIHSFQDYGSGVVKDKELAFIRTAQSDRFNVRYSVLVNQYVISKDEYEFWSRLKSTTEEGGGIFERQPYAIAGNIKNIKKPGEVVLGYFQVASVSSKRIYINPGDIGALKLPLYSNTCNNKIYSIGDMGESEPFRTLRDIYDYIVKHDSVFTMPNYDDITGNISGMTATSKVCSSCALTGDPNKPSFWTDN